MRINGRDAKQAVFIKPARRLVQRKIDALHAAAWWAGRKLYVPMGQIMARRRIAICLGFRERCAGNIAEIRE